MKDCKFLKPFEKEIQELYPDHKVEWYRSDDNTEYEEIRIDDKCVMNTDVGEYSDYYNVFNEGDGKKVFHHSIIVNFPFIDDTYDLMGFTIIDPYKQKIKPIRFELFCDHKMLREMFPYLMEKSDEVIKKVLANLYDLEDAQRDFYEC